MHRYPPRPYSGSQGSPASSASSDVPLPSRQPGQPAHYPAAPMDYQIYGTSDSRGVIDPPPDPPPPLPKKPSSPSPPSLTQTRQLPQPPPEIPMNHEQERVSYDFHK